MILIFVDQQTSWWNRDAKIRITEKYDAFCIVVGVKATNVVSGLHLWLND